MLLDELELLAGKAGGRWNSRGVACSALRYPSLGFAANVLAFSIISIALAASFATS
jgi:hypothetical protein